MSKKSKERCKLCEDEMWDPPGALVEGFGICSACNNSAGSKIVRQMVLIKHLIEESRGFEHGPCGDVHIASGDIGNTRVSFAFCFFGAHVTPDSIGEYVEMVKETLSWITESASVLSEERKVARLREEYKVARQIIEMAEAVCECE